MSDHPYTPGAPTAAHPPDPRPAGPARDFAAFCELDRERRRNSDDDFDPALFDEAVALALARLDPGQTPGSPASLPPGVPKGPAAGLP